MDPRELIQHFVDNEGAFDDAILEQFKAMIREKTQGWVQDEWRIFLQRLAREAWAIAVTKEGSDRQIFYAELAAYAEGVRDGRFRV